MQGNGNVYQSPGIGLTLASGSLPIVLHRSVLPILDKVERICLSPAGKHRGNTLIHISPSEYIVRGFDHR